jgi:SAM-dependent methyltransferase
MVYRKEYPAAYCETTIRTLVMNGAFNEHYFTTFYKNYRRQNPDRKLRWYREVLCRWTEGKNGRRILDAGCGPALFLRSLSGEWERFGIDPAHDLLRKCMNTTSRIECCGAVLDNPPFRKPFDVVTAFDVLEHTPSLAHTARAINRILTDAGLLIYVVPVYDGPAGLIVRALDKDPTHCQRLSRREWLTWTRLNFRLRWWCGVTRYLFFDRWYLHVPSELFRWVTPAILVVAERKSV